MMRKQNWQQLKLHCVTIEDLVPQEHLLRKVEAAVDFGFVYEETQDLYCPDNGRPSIDPVVLVKYLLIGFLFNLESERRIERETEVNMPYRWFLGLDIGARVPDHSTISQNRRRRFRGTGVFRRIFEGIVRQCIEKGLANGKVIVTDSTHIKANASTKRNVKIQAAAETTEYMRRLDEAEAEEERRTLEQAGKIRPQRKARAKKGSILQEKTVNSTDPDAGMLHRPGKPGGLHYLSHESIDPISGIIMDVAVTPGNVNDSEPFLSRIDYMREHLELDIQTIGADSAYGTSLIFHTLDAMGIQMYTPGVSGGATTQVEVKREQFQYKKETDRFICPKGKALSLRSLERERHNICRVYRAERSDCQNCPLFSQCVSASHHSRTLRVNIFEDAVQRQRSSDKAYERKEILKLRQVWCEGTFAIQKRGHNLTRILRRGLEAAEDHCLLSAIALNVKRMVKHMK